MRILLEIATVLTDMLSSLIWIVEQISFAAHAQAKKRAY